MLAIARREFASLLVTPVGWLLAAGTHSVLAWWFLTLVERYRTEYETTLVQTQSQLGVGDLIVAPFLGGLPVLTMLLVTAAALGVRSVAEERRQLTLELVLGSPGTSTGIVIGKYLGNLGVISLIVGIWALLPASLVLFTGIQPERIIAGIIGLWLAAAALLALALFTATLSRQAGVAGLLAFSLGLLLMLTGQAEDAELTRWLNLTNHYRDFLQGIVAVDDVIYFAVIAGSGLVLSIWRIDGMRQS